MIPPRFPLRPGTARRSLFASILPCLLLLISCRGGGDRPSRVGAAPPDTLTVVCYNVQNLFDLVRDGTEYGEYTPLTHNWNEFTFQTKLHHIAGVLAAARAQVVALCEIENRNVLEQLRATVAEYGVRYEYSAIGDSPNCTATCPAVLSMLPIVSTQSHGTVRVEGYFSRNILETDIAVGTDTFKVFVNHWPSKHHPESFRVATARILSARLERLPSQTEYIVLGDLNANYNEAETFGTEGLDNTRGRTGINHVLRTADSPPGELIDYVRESELGTCSKHCLYDLWLELPRSQRMSYVHEGRSTTPDHILLPLSLYDSSGLSYVDQSFEVFTFGGTLLRRGRPHEWQIGYGGKGAYHKAEGYSDHLPITARFHRGAFSATDSAPVDIADTRPHAWGGFESGTEGWLGMEPGVSVARDTVRAAQGAFSLRVAGVVGNRNATVARCVLRPRPAGARARRVRLSLRGRGELYWRVRGVGTTKWRYFSPPSYQASGSGRYNRVSYDAWHSVSLCLGDSHASATGLEVELRARGHSRIEVWVDAVGAE